MYGSNQRTSRVGRWQAPAGRLAYSWLEPVRPRAPHAPPALRRGWSSRIRPGARGTEGGSGGGRWPNQRMCATSSVWASHTPGLQHCSQPSPLPITPSAPPHPNTPRAQWRGWWRWARRPAHTSHCPGMAAVRWRGAKQTKTGHTMGPGRQKQHSPCSPLSWCGTHPAMG